MQGSRLACRALWGQQTLCLSWVSEDTAGGQLTPGSLWESLHLIWSLGFTFQLLMFSRHFGRCYFYIGIQGLDVFFMYSFRVCVFICNIGKLLRSRLGNNANNYKMPEKSGVGISEKQCSNFLRCFNKLREVSGTVQSVSGSKPSIQAVQNKHKIIFASHVFLCTSSR